MPQQYTVAELAAKIKAQYPVYMSVDDQKLVSQVIQKHPQYQNALKTEELQKFVNPDQPREAPKMGQVFSEVTTGTRHPFEQAKSERQALLEHPINTLWQATKQAGKTLAIDLPTAVLRHPVDTAVAMTGGNQFAEEIQRGNPEGAIEAVAGGMVNTLAGGKAAVESGAVAKLSEGAQQILKESVERVAQAKKEVALRLRKPGRINPATGEATKGPLKPAVKAVSAVGKLVGVPEIADAVIPAHPNPIDPRMGAGERVAGLKPWNMQEQLAQKPSAIIRPGDPSARMVGSEGRAATWTNERVMELAKQGNHEAIQQAVRRGMKLPANARYVAGDPSYSSGVYNPRDVTVFGPDGEPIRQGGKRLSVVQEHSTAPKVANKFATQPPVSNTPSIGLIKTFTDSVGTRWAEDANGVRVSIPKTVPDSLVQQYAKGKLAEQVAMRKNLGGK